MSDDKAVTVEDLIAADDDPLLSPRAFMYLYRSASRETRDGFHAALDRGDGDPMLLPEPADEHTETTP